MTKRKIAFVIAALFVPLVAWAGPGLYSSHSAVDPSNALLNNSDYTLVEYTNNMTCPTGDFDAHGTYPDNFCVESDTGVIISG